MSAGPAPALLFSPSSVMDKPWGHDEDTFAGDLLTNAWATMWQTHNQYRSFDRGLWKWDSLQRSQTISIEEVTRLKRNKKKKKSCAHPCTMTSWKLIKLDACLFILSFVPSFFLSFLPSSFLVQCAGIKREKDGKKERRQSWQTYRERAERGEREGGKVGGGERGGGKQRDRGRHRHRQKKMEKKIEIERRRERLTDSHTGTDREAPTHSPERHTRITRDLRLHWYPHCQI